MMADIAANEYLEYGQYYFFYILCGDVEFLKVFVYTWNLTFRLRYRRS